MRTIKSLLLISAGLILAACEDDATIASCNLSKANEAE